MNVMFTNQILIHGVDFRFWSFNIYQYIDFDARPIQILGTKTIYSVINNSQLDKHEIPMAKKSIHRETNYFLVSREKGRSLYSQKFDELGFCKCEWIAFFQSSFPKMARWVLQHLRYIVRLWICNPNLFCLNATRRE